ncbi:hypothetical protein L7F22_033917 [Adiantum nelumboides]|nr:hypothetical protein [Adiantum nelumboides]
MLHRRIEQDCSSEPRLEAMRTSSHRHGEQANSLDAHNESSCMVVEMADLEADDTLIVQSFLDACMSEQSSELVVQESMPDRHSVGIVDAFQELVVAVNKSQEEIDDIIDEPRSTSDFLNHMGFVTNQQQQHMEEQLQIVADSGPVALHQQEVAKVKLSLGMFQEWTRDLEGRVNFELDRMSVKNTDLQVENEMLQQRLKPLEALEKQVLAQEDVNVSSVLIDEGDLNLPYEALKARFISYHEADLLETVEHLKKEKEVYQQQLQEYKDKELHKNESPMFGKSNVGALSMETKSQQELAAVADIGGQKVIEECKDEAVLSEVQEVFKKFLLEMLSKRDLKFRVGVYCMAKLKEAACSASGDVKASTLQPKQGRPKRNPEELPRADAVKPKRLYEVNVTASVGGDDINKGLIMQMQQFLEKECVAGMCSLERGGIAFHLHLQMVARIMATSVIAISKKVNIYLGWDKNCPQGGNVLCRALQQKGMHTFEGMLGYCLKDAGKEHFENVGHNITPDMINTGVELYTFINIGKQREKDIINIPDYNKDSTEEKEKDVIIVPDDDDDNNNEGFGADYISLLKTTKATLFVS